ncbi:competence protein CoiA family protein [uncultured Pseudomonas sp.]|uniref:competence protein CoiA family protein n=1 Tax=uncultured Pseudomonas sp. TaxID=114707 RepID=UPI0030DB7587
MSMFYATAQDGRLLHIDDAERGLACSSTCLECGDPVIAKKGKRNRHHFAHWGGKEPCAIQPESLLHKLGKQVILEGMGLQLPALPGSYQSTRGYVGDRTSWWDFIEVIEEQTQQDFRPDLVAKLKDGTQLFIEIAVTSFVRDQKQEKIERFQEKTVELDLRYLLGMVSKPYAELCQHIIHETQHKAWLYPQQAACYPPDVSVENDPTLVQHSLTVPLPHPDAGKQQRFTVMGMWLTARRLNSGELTVRSLAYNPQIVELLKGWAHELGGSYRRRYRNWTYPASKAELLLERLEQLNEENG